MYVVNQVGTPLENSLFHRGSLAEALVLFWNFNKNSSGDVVVFRDLSDGRGSPKDWILVKFYSQSRYLSTIDQLIRKLGHP